MKMSPKVCVSMVGRNKLRGKCHLILRLEFYLTQKRVDSWFCSIGTAITETPLFPLPAQRFALAAKSRGAPRFTRQLLFFLSVSIRVVAGAARTPW
jgi:hypothetical protein